MPKKKVINEKEKMLKELARELKSSAKKIGPIKDLEEIGEESEEIKEENEKKIQSLNLRDFGFTQLEDLSEESSAPVLERRALAAPRPIFVGGIPQGTTADASEKGRNDEFKYVPGAANDNEPKYIGSDPTINPIERVNIRDAGRRPDFFSQTNQKALFDRVPEVREFQSQDLERIERVERFDIENAGRRNPFEEREAAFQRYKPKVPKG